MTLIIIIVVVAVVMAVVDTFFDIDLDDETRL